MIAGTVRPRWFLASVVTHAALIGGGIVWWGLAEATPRRTLSVQIDLATDTETVVQPDEPVLEPVESPEPLPDPEPMEESPDCEPEPLAAAPVTEQPPADPIPPTDLADRPREPVPVSDWLVVIRPPKVERPPVAVAAPPVVRTKIDPTPITAENRPPAYPARAAQLGIAGTVTLSVEVTAVGCVMTCRVATSSGSRMLDEAALRAVREWRFRDGPGTVLVPVVFTLALCAR